MRTGIRDVLWEGKPASETLPKLSSPEVAFGLCFPSSCLGLSQKFIKMLCHLPGLLLGVLPGCLLVAFLASPMKDLHIGWRVSDPKSLDSGLGGIRGRALHSKGSRDRQEGKGPAFGDDSFGGQEIIRTIY